MLLEPHGTTLRLLFGVHVWLDESRLVDVNNDLILYYNVQEVFIIVNNYNIRAYMVSLIIHLKLRRKKGKVGNN